MTDRGAFGDKFGFINSLFSGLALAGIIYSIFLQQKELSLQRTELKETKEEFKDQNFQTTFFNLLKSQHQIAIDISTSIFDLKSYDKRNSREAKGRDFFNQSRFELQRIDNALSNPKFIEHRVWNPQGPEDEPHSEEEEESLTKWRKTSFTFKYYKIDSELWESSSKLKGLERAERLYAIFFNKFHFVIGHYFRHIYHILLFVERTENERIERLKLIKNQRERNKEIEKAKAEFKQYAEFIQAQMSIPELFLLFYNSLSFPKLQRLLIKFNTLENLTIEDLLSEEHNEIEGINLKSRKELFK
ncbi:putative phage abortive infection protein [Psychroserpens luteolus]|uniref:putative phage abortive infection protein n=1 Tax=Psychroserpens luteolus TaxID=2855840 RepID=UPI001E4DBB3B|nr:putative phage abortive infection protein [Psychroserpens luteolus]MCD2260206.1 putative phage abortive infection protein [Psychroserpens luteolus]